MSDNKVFNAIYACKIIMRQIECISDIPLLQLIEARELIGIQVFVVKGNERAIRAYLPQTEEVKFMNKYSK